MWSLCCSQAVAMLNKDLSIPCNGHIEHLHCQHILSQSSSPLEATQHPGAGSRQPSYNSLNLPCICQCVVYQLLGRQLRRRSLVHWPETDLAILECPLPLRRRTTRLGNDCRLQAQLAISQSKPPRQGERVMLQDVRHEAFIDPPPCNGAFEGPCQAAIPLSHTQLSPYQMQIASASLRLLRRASCTHAHCTLLFPPCTASMLQVEDCRLGYG